MRSHAIFPSLRDEAARCMILDRLLTHSCLIPSLRSFFENQKYLEPCTVILKELLGAKEKRSLWVALRANFFWVPEDIVQIQSSEGWHSFRSLQSNVQALKEESFNFGYMQLWCFCLRHFPEMTKSSLAPRSEARRKPTQRDQSLALWKQFGSLALKLGFKTDHAVRLAEDNTDIKEAEQFLRSARPGWKLKSCEQVRKIVEILRELEAPNPTRTAPPRFTSDQYWPHERRCGRPYDNDHDHDKNNLFIPLLYSSVGRGTDVSSLFVKRDMLLAFFANDNLVRSDLFLKIYLTD